jgi:hypothetical protein
MDRLAVDPRVDFQLNVGNWTRPPLDPGPEVTSSTMVADKSRAPRATGARLTSPDDGLVVEFEASLAIGRHPDNDLAIDDRRVSSRHAVIEFREDRWRIRDLDSSNGTSVDGKRFKGWRRLSSGALIRFAGVSRWRVEGLTPTGEAPAVDLTERDIGDDLIGDFELHLEPTRPDEGRIRVRHATGEWKLTTGQRFLLLFVLANRPGEWIDDEDLRTKLWGKASLRETDASALHKLLYDTRRMLIEEGFDGWLIKKNSGRTQLAMGADRVHVDRS